MAFIFWIFTVACIGIAVTFGGREGRIATSMLLVAAIATVPIQQGIQSWTRVSPALLACDSALFGGLFWLAAISDRSWLVWMAGLQLNAVLANIATMLAPDVTERIYIGLETIWALPILALMTFGVVLDQVHERRYSISPGE
jgi:hypothetical protein